MILHQNLGVIICGSSTGPVAVWSMDQHTLSTSLEGHEGIFIFIIYFKILVLFLFTPFIPFSFPFPLFLLYFLLHSK